MPIIDKVAAAKQIGEFLQALISNGGFKLKYRITVDPPIAQNREWEHPEILVEFAGPDSALLLERGGELLRSFELLASEILHLQGNEHEKIWFDCKNFRAMRIDELQLAARVAAEVARTPQTWLWEGALGQLYYGLGAAYVRLDEPDSALDCLDKALAGGWRDAHWLACDPEFKALRSQTRFQSLQENLRVLPGIEFKPSASTSRH